MGCSTATGSRVGGEGGPAFEVDFARSSSLSAEENSSRDRLRDGLVAKGAEEEEEDDAQGPEKRVKDFGYPDWKPLAGEEMGPE